MIHRGHVRMLYLAGRLHRAGKGLVGDGLTATWRAVDAVKANAEKPVARAYARILRRQAEAVLSAWQRKGPGLVDEAKRVPDSVAALGAMVFDVRDWLGAVDEDIRPLLLAAIEEGFASGAMRIGQELTFRMTDRAEAELGRIVGLVKDANETTRDSIGRVIRDGLEHGRSVDDVAAALRATFTDWQDWRARTVAQTSTTSVFEVAQQEAWTEAGVSRNRWLSMRDDRVRAEHDAMDGEEVAVGEAFSNGLEYPQEPNCRCSLLPAGTEDVKGLTLHPEAWAAINASDESMAEFMDYLRDKMIEGAGRAHAARVEEYAVKGTGRPWLQERNAAIRADYPGLRDKHGREVALSILGERHSLSPDRVYAIYKAR
jgi:SPP1 gp7 family putative phage head morphogenesis protein